MPDKANTWQSALDAMAAGSVIDADPGPFEHHETHVSEVLVSPRVAYKFKKPLAFGFLDYSTLERRRELCHMEVSLNRRLAPDVYLGTGAIVDTEAGFQLAMDYDEHGNEAVEWVVVMRYVDHKLVLSRRVDLGLVTEQDLRDVGTTLAQFHLAAPQASRQDAGSTEATERWLSGCLASLQDVGGKTIGAKRIDGFASFVRRWLAVNGDRLATRAAEGWIRDGHGDLRLEHVVIEDGSVAVLDCVEFNAGLRECDVLADLSFLVMELELARRPDLVGVLTGTWANLGGPLDESVLWFFAACKAFVRAEVGARRASQLDNGYERMLVVDMARAHMSLAERLAWRTRRPAVVVIAGLSGSGKTTTSKVLAKRWEVARYASDEIRRQIVGIAQGNIAPDRAYATQINHLVYARLGTIAAEALASGRSVVIDATFRHEEDRASFREPISRLNGKVSGLVTVLLTASEEVLRQRVYERETRDDSEAGIAVLDEQLTTNGSRAIGMPGQLIEVDAEALPEEVAAGIDRELLGHVDIRKLDG